MDTLSKRLSTIATIVNLIFISLVYFTRNFFISLEKTGNFSMEANAYMPSLTNEKFYELLSSTSVTAEMFAIIVITLMFSLAFMRIYKNKDKSALKSSAIMITLIGISDLIIHFAFSILKGSENFKNLWVEGITPIATAMQYTVFVAILYVLCTFINKKKGKE